MSKLKLALVISLTFIFLCLFTFVSLAKVVQASDDVLLPARTTDSPYTALQTSIITTSIYPSDTAIIFEELGISIKEARILTIADVQGTSFTIYDSDQLEQYYNILKDLEDLCTLCNEPECEEDPLGCIFGPLCVLPCCDLPAVPCMVIPTMAVEIVPTSVFETEIGDFQLSDEIIQNYPEDVNNFVDY